MPPIFAKVMYGIVQLIHGVGVCEGKPVISSSSQQRSLGLELSP